MKDEKMFISVGRFEELISKETRLDVLTDKLINENCISVEDALRIIGSDDAIRKANRIMEEDKKRREEYLRSQYSEENV